MIQRMTQALSAVSFGRGLALGALVGAAIAGSTLWSRLRGVQDGARSGASTRPAAPAGNPERTTEP